VTIGVQAVILVLVAIPFGLQPSWVGVIVTLVLVCVLALGISGASYSMGIILKDEDAFAPFVQGVSLPLLLLSGVFLPMSLAPTWLHNLSRINPLVYLVDASRSLFVGDYSATNVVVGIIVTAVLTGLLAWWGTRTFQRMSA